jgi:hypothetical protein
MKRVFWALLVCLLLVLPAANPARAADGGVTIPPGFRKIDGAIGIQLYQKDYPGGSPDYVQVIDLSQGASLKSLHGSISDPGAGQGAYGGNDARFRSQSLAAYWQELAAQEPEAFCVINGQFFYMLEYPTRLPFPLKIDGQVLTDGYGIQDFPDQKLMLELWPGKADIVPLSKEALYASSAPDIIAGLAEDAPKAKKRYTGRTFIGLAGPNSQGRFETLMILSTKTARQVDAAGVLKSFGAQKVMMLDGGGSAQLLCRGRSFIYSERLVPQAIGIVAGVAAQDQPAAQPQPAAESADLQAAAPPPPGNSNPVTNASAYAIASSKNPAPVDRPVSVLLPALFTSAPSAKNPVPEPDAALGSQAADHSEGSTAPLATATPQLPAEALAASIPPGQEPADQGQAALAAGVYPVSLDDALLVPASMAPILMILLVGIFKIRRP